MYRRILVPLDGSKLAEQALPHVETIAQGCDTEEVILVSVTERLLSRWPTGSKSYRSPWARSWYRLKGTLAG